MITNIKSNIYNNLLIFYFFIVNYGIIIILIYTTIANIVNYILILYLYSSKYLNLEMKLHISFSSLYVSIIAILGAQFISVLIIYSIFLFIKGESFKIFVNVFHTKCLFSSSVLSHCCRKINSINICFFVC